MNKVFLSHSSADKGRYLDVVARVLGEQNIEYDAITFEEGEKSEDEIRIRIDQCDLFALFISGPALDSKWVLGEIDRARERLGSDSLRKFYPIIIDPSITYTDKRLPEWIVKDYNLKQVGRPVVAARRIETKLRQLYWSSHPLSEERKRIFVGRNELLAEFERRVDDVDIQKPVCVIASGLSAIGRSKFLQHALSKASMVSSFYEPIKIVLQREDSIEDLIVKIFDTGLTQKSSNDLLDLLNTTVDKKIDILVEMLRDVSSAKEVLFVEDRGCLVNHMKDVASWLSTAIGRVSSPRPIICIAATYRVNPRFVRGNQKFFAVEIPELGVKERAGLLRRLLDLYDFSISPAEFSFFSEQLKGYPEEAIYCANLIADLGVDGAKQNSHLITEFNSERASLLLRKYEENQKVLDFIYLLSEFEFVGVKFIFSIVDPDEYSSLLDELVTNLICDYVGIEREYVRLNDTIRDLIRRNRLKMPDVFLDKLRAHVKEFVQESDKFERDAADFFYSIKTALAQGQDVDQRYLAPSHILRTIKELYYSRDSYKRLIKLADLLLEKEAFLDKRVSDDVRYYLCLALARQKDKRVLQEAMKIDGPEHDFILGYYYRVCGRHAEAIERLTKLLDKAYIVSRAKRELVQVYLYIEEFDKATDMARDNYLANRGNQYPIQSYLQCLLNANGDASVDRRNEIERLINELSDIGSPQSKEMCLIARALYEGKFNGRKDVAYELIEQANSVQGSHYPMLAKFDIALRFRDVDGMCESLEILKGMQGKKTFSKNTIVKNEAYYLAITGRSAEASAALSEGLENYPPDSMRKITAKLASITDARKI